MADNTPLNSGAGGDTLATDDIGGVKYPRSKMVIGADGTNDGDVSAANPLPVKGTGAAGTANAGVVTVQGIASMTPVVTGSGVAHDAADSGNPHKVGARATTSISGLTMVANAARTDLFAGVDGVQIVRTHCNLEDIVTATPVAITDGSSTSVIAAQGAGIKVYIVEVIIANSSASNVTVDLRDGVAGAVKATFPVPANGGVVKTLTTPLPFTPNTAVAADPSAAASTITVTLIGFKSKV